MANSKDSLRSLVEGLYNATMTGRIKWQPVSKSSSYLTSLRSSAIEIADDMNNNGEPVIVVNVYDQLGNIVDSFNDDYLHGYKPHNLSYDSYYTVMKNLQEMARRNATGADRIIQSILTEIGAPSVDDDIPF